MKHAINRVLLVVILATLSLGGAGCSRKTIIPDSDLERITREMFLVNAYASNQKLQTDSLDIYTPILERYGYTQQDFFNTLANFQKRKSARLSDVVEASISSLENLAAGYEQKLRNLRFVDSLAKAQCSREVLWRERVVVRRWKDTTRLHLTLPIEDCGEYVVSYNYYIDSLDKNLRLQSNHEIFDAEGRRTFFNRNTLTREDSTHYTTTIRPKEGAVEYRLTLADYTRREDEPHIVFDSVRIVYLPPSEVALAKMDSTLRFRPLIYFNDSIRVRGYLDAVPPMLPHDTVWIRIDSLDLAKAQELRTCADSLDGEGAELVKEVEKLLARGEKLRTRASKRWYRNDSLRQVAHLRNVAEADSLSGVGDSLKTRAEELRVKAEERRAIADSIDVVLGIGN